MKNLKSLLLILALILLFVKCENENIIDSKSIEINTVNVTPNINSEVEFLKNNDFKIEYFFKNKPNEIYSITKSVTQLERSENNLLVSLAGDIDNFGYGIGNSLPCSYYNLSDPIIDLGVFDKVDYGDAPLNWTQRFDQYEEFGEGSIALSVLIEINEAYSDGNYSNIEIDGLSYNFTVNGPSYCGEVIQTFYFTGEDAAFANDGIINFTFNKNGDAISLDYCKVTVDYTPSNDFDGDGCLNEEDPYPHSIMTSTIVIDGIDTGVENTFENCGTMSDEIQDIINQINSQFTGDNYYTLHKKLSTEVSKLTYYWLKDRKITSVERSKIGSAIWRANIPYLVEDNNF